jgi:acid phosphatase family membrane protein YuiD
MKKSETVSQLAGLIERLKRSSVNVVVTQASCTRVEQDSSLVNLAGRMPAGHTAKMAVLTLPVARAQPLQGEAGDFARIFQVEFVFDVCTVCLHRFGAEVQ